MLPTFLGIGVPSGGTTWLSGMLTQHPEIWMPPYKELHYFDRDTPLFSKRQYMRERRNRHVRRYAYAALRDPARLRQLPMQWDLRYFFGKRSHAWYVSLFRPAPGQIAGEITPAYMNLERSTVEEIRQLNPELRVFFIMRDPLDRAWSAAVKYLARNRQRTLDEIPEHEIFEHFDKQQLHLMSNYPRTLDNWEGVFGRSQVFIGFFEEIQNDPRALLLRLFRFLGVDATEKHIPATLRIKVNSTAAFKTDFPIKFQKYLAERCYTYLAPVAQRFGEPVTGWLQRMETLLDA